MSGAAHVLPLLVRVTRTRLRQGGESASRTTRRRILEGWQRIADARATGEVIRSVAWAAILVRIPNWTGSHSELDGVAFRIGQCYIPDRTENESELDAASCRIGRPLPERL